MRYQISPYGYKSKKEVADPTTTDVSTIDKLSNDLKTSLTEYETQLNTLIEQSEK